jgi:type VI secretion system secreted protein VgrG
MTNGSQWTAIWYQNGLLLKYQTMAWDSGTGGYGQDKLSLPAEQWVPGIYQLVFFVGRDWKVLGEFRVMGNPPTETISVTPSGTTAPSMTSSVTRTPMPTGTPRPSDTRWPSPTSTK